MKCILRLPQCTVQTTTTGAESLILFLIVGGVRTHLLVVLLERRKILTGLGEFALFHAFTDVPVHERALGVHEVELVVDAGQSLSHRGGVGHHAQRALHSREVAARHHGRWLVVDADFHASRRPVHELDGALALGGGHSGVHVLRGHVTAVKQAARHVLAVARVALGHHGRRLEHHVGHLSHRALLVHGLVGANQRRVRLKHEMNARVWHQVSLELVQVHVERAVETERSGQRRGHLRHHPVQVRVRWRAQLEGGLGDRVQGLVIEAEGHVAVLEEGVGRKHAVVRLHHRRRDLRRRGDAEVELALAAVVHREALEHEGTEAGASATTRRVVHQEALEAAARVGQLADAVHRQVKDFLAHSVVATSVVVGGVFLASQQLLRVVHATVGAHAHLIHHRRLEVHENRARHVFAGRGLRKEGVERIVFAADGLVRRHHAVRLDAVLEGVELQRY